MIASVSASVAGTSRRARATAARGSSQSTYQGSTQPVVPSNSSVDQPAAAGQFRVHRQRTASAADTTTKAASSTSFARFVICPRSK